MSVMGQYGLSSRILSKKLNSQIVYTFTPEYIKKNKLEQELIDPETLEDLYNFSKINNKTRLYGVIGKDVNTSLSPKIHNEGFKIKDLNSVYIPISAVSSKEALDFANLLNIKGLSVTAPFKSEIIPK